jgi:tol-pal system protein YbgF
MRRLTVAVLLAASSLAQAETLSQSAQSELVLMIQQLQAEVRQLRGEIETQQYRLQKLEREQLERYRDVDRRLSALILGGGSAAAPAPQPAASAPAPVEQAPAQESVAATPAPAAPAPAPAAVSDSEAYASAFALVRERRFDEALTAFEGFVATYPSSDRLANAHYWIGEVQLAQQKLEPARAAFQLVVDQFGQHPKRPDALYKLGVTQDRLGDLAARTSTFEQLIANYPKSSAAGLARNYQSR